MAVIKDVYLLNKFARERAMLLEGLHEIYWAGNVGVLYYLSPSLMRGNESKENTEVNNTLYVK